MGLFTMYGTAPSTSHPLSGLTKSRVRAIRAHLGAPEHLVVKVPTSDLEDDRPGLPDEHVHGVTMTLGLFEVTWRYLSALDYKFTGTDYSLRRIPGRPPVRLLVPAADRVKGGVPGTPPS